MTDQDRLRRLQQRVYGPSGDLDAVAELRELLRRPLDADREPIVSAARVPAEANRRPLTAIALVLGLLLLAPRAASTASPTHKEGSLPCPTGWSCVRTDNAVIAKPARSAASMEHLPAGTSINVDSATGRALSATWPSVVNGPLSPGVFSRP